MRTLPVVLWGSVLLTIIISFIKNSFHGKHKPRAYIENIHALCYDNNDILNGLLFAFVRESTLLVLLIGSLRHHIKKWHRGIVNGAGSI